MPKRIEVGYGEDLTVVVGGRIYTLAVAVNGHVFLAGPRGAYLPPPNEDSDSEHKTFEVYENHHAYSDQAAGAEAIRSAPDGEADIGPRDLSELRTAGELILALVDLVLKTGDLKSAGLLVLRCRFPDLSIREVIKAAGLTLKRSVVGDTSRRLGEHLPVAALHQTRTNRAAGQHRRREREAADRTNRVGT